MSQRYNNWYDFVVVEFVCVVVIDVVDVFRLDRSI